MKKRYFALIILAALLIIIVAALKLAPIIAKNYVVEHSEELIGRKIKIKEVTFSPLTFIVTINDFAIFEQDGTTPFVAFENFRINVNPSKLISKEINVSEIYLKGLYTRVTQKGSQFNFSDILDKFITPDSSHAPADSLAQANIATASKDSTAKDSIKALNLDPSQALGGFSVAIENIVLEKGNIIYEDQKVGSKIHLEDFSAEIPAVYFSNKNTDIGINLKFANGGDLGVKVLFNMQTQDFDINVALHKFALSIAKPYLNDFISYKDFQGTLATNLAIAGNVNDVLSSNISGTVALDSINLAENSGKSIGVNHIGIGITKANLNQMDFKVDSVVVNGAFAHLDLFKNGKTNIDELLSPLNKKAPDDAQKPIATAPQTAPAKPLKFVINKLQVANTSVTAVDHTPKQVFSYKISNVSVSGSNINFDTPCTINVSAAFPEGGSMTLKYKGAISNIGTMDAYISVKNLALKNFSPYSHHFTGYPISSGTMAFASENKLNNFDIESKNTIDIYNINVADKDPNTSPEFTVPMKVGLYILKDKDDKIQFDVPVKGNVKDPEFSYLKIVWKTVMNLLIKVALSPLKVVGNIAATGANAVGFDLGKDDEIIIDPLTANFESEQYDKAHAMVSAIAKDPKFKMNFVQSFNLKKTLDAYKIRKIKTEFYKASQNKSVLNELDEKNILQIADKDSAYITFATEFEKTLDRKTLEKEILDMANKRNDDLLKTLQQQGGVTKKNVTIQTAPRGVLVHHKGKPMYKVQIDVE